jgi:hypothetical protein
VRRVVQMLRALIHTNSAGLLTRCARRTGRARRNSLVMLEEAAASFDMDSAVLEQKLGEVLLHGFLDKRSGGHGMSDAHVATMGALDFELPIQPRPKKRERRSSFTKLVRRGRRPSIGDIKKSWEARFFVLTHKCLLCKLDAVLVPLPVAWRSLAHALLLLLLLLPIARGRFQGAEGVPVLHTGPWRRGTSRSYPTGWGQRHADQEERVTLRVLLSSLHRGRRVRTPPAHTAASHLHALLSEH